jgi:adenylosuccinate synthase
MAKSQEARVPSVAFREADILQDDGDIDRFKQDADVRVYTGRSDGRDTLIRVAARLGLYSSPSVRCVDVVVGGQYGSEGKGHIAAYLARNYLRTMFQGRIGKRDDSSS